MDDSIEIVNEPYEDIEVTIDEDDSYEINFEPDLDPVVRVIAVKGPKGDKGDTGEPGSSGADGEDGYTPVRGVDYWTESDKAEIIEDVTEELADEFDGKADVIIRSASGDIVNITDGADNAPVERLTVDIEPVQDLHGYDAPWPAGGGKNLADFTDGYGLDAYGVNVTNTKRTSTITPIIIEQGASYVYTSETGKGAIIAVWNGDTLVRRTAGIASGATLNTSDGDRFYITAYGSSDEIITAANDKPMVRKSTSPPGYAPYSNICPITGRDGAKVTRTGKNLLPIRTMRTSNAGIDYTVSDEGIYVHGTATSASYSWGGIAPDEAWLYLKAGTYTFSVNNMFGESQADGYVVFMGWDKYGNAIQNRVVHNASKNKTVTFTEDVRIFYGIYVKSGLTVDTVLKIQLELGSEATDYEPYAGETYDISWETEAGTIYGGKLDATTGELTVDRAMVTKTASDTWSYSASYIACWGNPSALNNDDTTQISNLLVGGGPNYQPFGKWRAQTNGAIVVGNREKWDDIEEFKRFIDDNGGTLQFCYKIAEPQVYHLTPTQIKTLLGENHIWADCGTIDAEYHSDTKMYVDDIRSELLAELGEKVGFEDYASADKAGVVKISGYGLQIINGFIRILSAQDSAIKISADTLSPVTPFRQHTSVFYGLAKAAGDTTQSASSNAVGTYTDNAKSKIKSMLGVETTVNVSGTTPTITAAQNTRYICGEVTSLSFTPCASGICDVRFTSGSSATVLTLPNTVKMPEWWDGSCEPNTIYEINILDGVYGAVMTWEA